MRSTQHFTGAEDLITVFKPERRGKMRLFSNLGISVFLVLGLILSAGIGYTAEPIKLGAVFSLSGAAAHNGVENKFIVDYMVNKVNKEGGINGRPIKLIFCDDESDATKTVLCFKRLFETEKVHVAVGPNRTDTGMAAKGLIQKAQIPTFMNVGGDPVITAGKFGPFKWNWKSPQRSSVAIKRVYMWLKKQNIKKIAMFLDSSGFGMDGKRHIERLAPEYGVKIVASEMAHPKDTDATPQLTRIKATDAGALFAWAFGPLTAIISKNVKQLGIKIPEVQNHGMAGPMYLSMAGKNAEGTIFVSSKILVAEQLPDTDPVTKFNLELIRIYKKHNRPLHAQAPYGYDMINIVIDGLKRAGTDRFKLRDAIEQTRGFVGATGVFNMSPEDHNGLGVGSLVMIQVAGGKWKLIDY